MTDIPQSGAARPDSMKRPNTAHRAAVRRIALAIAAGYVLVLVLIVFWPTSVDAGGHDWLVRTLSTLHRHGAPDWLNYAVVEFGANIVLFVPAGLFVVLLSGSHRWWWGPVFGFAASCLIELCQMSLLSARFATIHDVIANTLGAVIGSLLGVVLLRLLNLRHSER